MECMALGLASPLHAPNPSPRRGPTGVVPHVQVREQDAPQAAVGRALSQQVVLRPDVRGTVQQPARALARGCAPGEVSGSKLSNQVQVR